MAKLKCCVPRLLQKLTEDVHDCSSEFCKWFQMRVNKQAHFVDKIVIGLMKQHFNAMIQLTDITVIYWSSENPHIHLDMSVDVPGFTVWCVVQGIVEPYFFKGLLLVFTSLTSVRLSLCPKFNSFMK